MAPDLARQRHRRAARRRAVRAAVATDPKQWARIEGALLAGPCSFGFDGQLWTLARIRIVIAQLTGVTYDPAHVWALLRANDWTPQKPARRALERDDDAIAGWVKQTWPQVTGGSQAEDVDCLS